MAWLLYALCVLVGMAVVWYIFWGFEGPLSLGRLATGAAAYALMCGANVYMAQVNPWMYVAAVISGGCCLVVVCKIVWDFLGG